MVHRLLLCEPVAAVSNVVNSLLGKIICFKTMCELFQFQKG